MNSGEKRARPYKIKLAWAYVLRYFITLIMFLAIFVGVILVGRWICGRFTWYQSDPFYRFLIFIDRHIEELSVVSCLIVWAGLTCYYIAKPWRYVNEMMRAAEKLTSPDAEPIALPAELRSAQDRLNLFRERGYRNALLAKEAEQRKNDLIVYLAHDLKTPLTSVIGYLGLLKDEPQLSDTMRQKYTDIALNKAERLEELVNELFDIARFNLSTLALEPGRTSLSRMLEQLVNEFEPILNEKSLTAAADIEPNVELVCDGDKLGRVFDNLMRNAVSYSYEGTKIALSMRREGTNAVVKVENHGRTIPHEKLSHIFEQFYRVDPARSTEGGGAGLGLAIAKEIVELHGGTIQVESADELTRFTVSLPA